MNSVGRPQSFWNRLPSEINGYSSNAKKSEPVFWRMWKSANFTAIKVWK